MASNLRRRTVLAAAAGAGLAACAVPGITHAAPPVSPARRIVASHYGDDTWQGRVLWMDLAANLAALDSRDKVRAVMQRTAAAGFSTVIVDVKNSTGFVAYLSGIAPHVSTASFGKYPDYPPDHDLLAVATDEGHAAGLEVIAALNMFGEGSTPNREGTAFEHPEWQTQYLTVRREARAADGATRLVDGVDTTRESGTLILYTPAQEASPANRWGVEAQVSDGLVTQVVDRRQTDAPAVAIPPDGYVLSGHGEAATWLLAHLHVGDQVAVEASSTIVPAAERLTTNATFVNALLPEVQDYELSIIEEVATRYDIDGICLDRARYSNVYADFSDESRQAFEEWQGAPVEQWPADVLSFRLDGFEATDVRGPLFNAWIEFRAGVVADFFARAGELVRRVAPKIAFTDYVGAWYPLYYSEGVNWASRHHQPDFEWASPTYHQTGYAEELDFLMVGTYFPEITEEEAIENDRPASWYSVEGSANVATEAVADATWVYASLYLLQYADSVDRFRAAMEMAMRRTHGVMVFDLVYLEQYGWWDAVAEVFAKFGETKEPHTHPAWRQLLRADT